MMKRSISLAVVSTATFFATTAWAQDGNWYGTASVGLGSLDSETLVFDNGTETSSARAEFESSFAGGGAIGYRFSNGWALEGDIMYRRNEMDPIDIPNLGNFTEGDFASLSLGINALYHFEFDRWPAFSAYVGGGFVFIEEIDIDFDDNGAQEISFETDDTAFQVKLGGHYDFNDRWFMDGGLTYLTAGDVTMTLPADGTQSVTTNYDHLTASIGIGIRF